MLFTQPVGACGWLAGKAAALAALLGPASVLLIVPAALAERADGRRSAFVAAAAAGVVPRAGAARSRGRLLGARSRARPAGRARGLVRPAVRHRPRCCSRCPVRPWVQQHADALGAAADAQPAVGAARDDAVQARADRAGQHRRRSRSWAGGSGTAASGWRLFSERGRRPCSDSALRARGAASIYSAYSSLAPRLLRAASTISRAAGACATRRSRAIPTFVSVRLTV